VSPFFISGEFLWDAGQFRPTEVLVCRSSRRLGAVPFDIAQLRALTERVAASSGLEIVDLELHGTGKARTLKIFIEKNAEGRRALEQQLAAARAAGEKVPSPDTWDQLAGVTHEDCANFSRELGTILDVEDSVPGGEYLLEVSSPGLDRKLVSQTDFERFTGSKVKLMTREPISGNRHFEGRLQGMLGDRIQLSLEPSRKREGRGKKSKAAERVGKNEASKLEIEIGNVERARLVPEF
jgi:ribosome maturation factor RimP